MANHRTIRLTDRLGFGGIDKLAESMQREERLRFTAHELGHRTKNLLAIVQAIASQVGQQSADLKDFQKRFFDRLHGLSRSLDLLTEEKSRGASIAGLVRSQLQPFGEIDGVRMAIDGPALFLNPEATRNIGLALHELATNATKHGALSVPEGIVTVDWQITPGDEGPSCFHLIWRERNGPTVIPPTRRGFGHVILQRMTSQSLQGNVNHAFDALGVSWALEVPLVAVAMPRQFKQAAERHAESPQPKWISVLGAAI
jgi:two-component sensor histidine kinase